MRFYLIPLACGAMLAAEYMAPAGDRPTVPRPGAVTVLPGGRMLQPVGRQYPTGATPLGLAVNRPGDRVVTVNSGPDEFSITILRRDSEGRYLPRNFAAPREGTPEGRQETWRAVSTGVAFAGDNEVFVSEGDSGRVRRVNVNSPRKAQLYELNRDGFSRSYAGNLAYDSSRQLLYVVDQANFRVVVFDGRSRRVLGSVATGRLPFGIALAPDGKRVYVTNIGMLSYKPLPGAALGEVASLPFPAFGFPSPAAINGARVENAGRAVEVPGLGDPNADESSSVAVVNVEDPAGPRIEAFVRTGTPLGEGVHGGSSPSAVLAAGDRVFVANAHNDSISVFDAATLKPVGKIEIRIPGLEDLRGALPVSLAWHEASSWLLAAQAGINAVAVVDARSLQALGHAPVAWHPAAIRVQGDDIFVVNAKGHGTGATANRMVGFSERFQEPRFQGSLTVFPVPGRAELPRLTQRVMQLNGFAPLRGASTPAYPSEIRHVALIVKEGRTFDEVFGDVDQAINGPVEAAPMLARFGRYGSAGEAGGGFQPRFSLRGINVTPNHHALADRWSFSDNFYADAETSAGGHRWLAGAPPNAWTLSSASAGHAGQKQFGLAPSGRLLFPGRSLSLHPEEIPERGALWHHLERHGVEFRNFGLGFDLPGVGQDQPYLPTGARFLTNMPMPEPLFWNTSRDYPGFNINIPDQHRATQFIREIDEQYAKPGRPLPRFVSIYLPNDHMARARPNDGYPFTTSYVADNDLALGRIVEYLSRSPWWKNMAIFVVESSAHGGVDHVDSHRTVMLAIGPYMRKNYASHRNTSFPGLLKTIFRTLNLPPLNLLDAAATDLSDCFASEPDFAGYDALPVNAELFDPARVMAAFEGTE
ncbi:MAG: bifunctional YncE family protein/alkaline phosphatase family protein [Bryobacteraceae bacterium]|nr:bifunctional YncE family protein/alkaline phosphatase family protein [Bryobacteraceae bacterium]